MALFKYFKWKTATLLEQRTWDTTPNLNSTNIFLRSVLVAKLSDLKYSNSFDYTINAGNNCHGEISHSGAIFFFLPSSSSLSTRDKSGLLLIFAVCKHTACHVLTYTNIKFTTHASLIMLPFSLENETREKPLPLSAFSTCWFKRE